MEHLKSHIPMKRLFVDMDGTLATFLPSKTLEDLYEPGYFRSLKPMVNIVKAVKLIIHNHLSLEVYTLSAVLDSPYAIPEKNAWLDEHLPEITQSHRLFIACGEDKKNVVPGGVGYNDFLLDDYTKNLVDWELAGQGIKVLNGINHTFGTWKGVCIQAKESPFLLEREISRIVNNDDALKKSKKKEVDNRVI